MPATVAAGRGIRVPLLDTEERGVFTFGSRPGRVRRGPWVSHACKYHAGTHSCQLFVFNNLFHPDTKATRENLAALTGEPKRPRHVPDSGAIVISNS